MRPREAARQGVGMGCKALLAAEERKEPTLEITNIVANCPVTRVQGGQALKGVR